MKFVLPTKKTVKSIGHAAIQVAIKPVCWLHKLIRGFEPWGILLAIIGLFLTMLGFMLELEDRQSERVFRAWEVVLGATKNIQEDIATNSDDEKSSNSTYSSGSSVRQALEYLNREFSGRWCSDTVNSISKYFIGNQQRECVVPKKRRESFENFVFASMDLSTANLQSVNLEGANLRFANLQYADLRDANLRFANLSHASLDNADLRGADLHRANLSISNLRGADLRGANLSFADLEAADLEAADLRKADLLNANLLNANLSSANLSDVQKLFQGHLDEACADSDTPPELLPKFIWKGPACPW